MEYFVKIMPDKRISALGLAMGEKPFRDSSPKQTSLSTLPRCTGTLPREGANLFAKGYHLIYQTVAVAPFVVVPSYYFNKVALDDLGKREVNDRRVWIAHDVA